MVNFIICIPPASVVTLSGVDETVNLKCITAVTVIEYSVDCLRSDIVGEVEELDSLLISGELIKQFPSLVRIVMYKATGRFPGCMKNRVRDVEVRDNNVRLTAHSNKSNNNMIVIQCISRVAALPM